MRPGEQVEGKEKGEYPRQAEARAGIRRHHHQQANQERPNHCQNVDQVAACVVMLPLSPATRIFVALQPVDLRAGFNGLGAQVETRLNHDTWSGHPFVFIKRVTFCPYPLFS